MAAEAVKHFVTASMKRKQILLIKHTESLKGTMFNKAKDRMLASIKKLTVCSLLHVNFKNEKDWENSVTQVNRLLWESLNKMSVWLESFFFLCKKQIEDLLRGDLLKAMDHSLIESNFPFSMGKSGSPQIFIISHIHLPECNRTGWTLDPWIHNTNNVFKKTVFIGINKV